MKKLLLISAFSTVLALASCKQEKTTGITRLSVKMTDAPGAYTSLLLSIKEIQVLTSEGITILPVSDKPFDILRFRMGKDTLIASQDITSGRLQEVRLVLNDTGNEVVIDDLTFPLTTPSGQSSGVKIKLNTELTEGSGYTLLLDFDAAKSVVKTGNAKFVLKPVIRAIAQAVSGSLRGKISPATSNSKVFAINAQDTVGTVADSLGNFFFKGLAEGTYKVNIEPVSPLKAASVENVEITKGSLKDLGEISLIQ